MRLSAETHLLEKRIKQAFQPLEIFASAVLATLVFAIVLYCSVFSIRYTDKGLASALKVICLIFCCVLVIVAGLKWRSSRPSRTWISFALCSGSSLAAAHFIGDRYWNTNTINYYNLQDMASYVNIDPATDKGQSYMDAGTVYFKEGSRVLRSRAVAFRNGLTYCVAPVVRAPINYQEDSGAPQTESGFVMPQSGTVDFWAVGTDCCDRDGNTFNCGEVGSQLSRSGLRLLDDTARSMYLLAVQEWSATTGLPVRHPLFFHWVRDPIRNQRNIIANAWQDYWLHLIGCAAISLSASALLHTLMQQCYVH